MLALADKIPADALLVMHVLLRSQWRQYFQRIMPLQFFRPHVPFRVDLRHACQFISFQRLFLDGTFAHDFILTVYSSCHAADNSAQPWSAGAPALRQKDRPGLDCGYLCVSGIAEDNW